MAIDVSNIGVEVNEQKNRVVELGKQIGEVAAGTTRQYVDSQTAGRDDQDCFKFVGDKVYKAAAISALIGGNYADSIDRGAYKDTMSSYEDLNSTEGGRAILDEAGIGTKAQSQLQSTLDSTVMSAAPTKAMSELAKDSHLNISAGAFVPTAAPDLSYNTSGGVFASFKTDAKSLTSSESAELSANGSFSRGGVRFTGEINAVTGEASLSFRTSAANSNSALSMVAGSREGYANVKAPASLIVGDPTQQIRASSLYSPTRGSVVPNQRFGIDETQAARINKAQTAARTEREARDRILNANSTSQKRAAMSEFRQRIAAANKNLNPDIENFGPNAALGKGRTASLRNAAQGKGLFMKGAMRDGARAAGAAAGAGARRRSNGAAMRRRGAAIVRRELLGDDFGGSVNVLTSTGKVATAGVKATYSVSRKVAGRSFDLGTRLVDVALKGVGAGVAGVGTLVGNRWMAATGSRIGSANTQKARDFAAKRRKVRNDRIAAKRNGTSREFRAKRREERMGRRIDKLKQKSDSFSARSKLASGRKATRLNRKSQRLGRRAGRLTMVKDWLKNLSDAFGRVGRVVSAPFRIIRAPFRSFSRIIDAIKRKILVPLVTLFALIILGIPIAFTLIMNLSETVIHFFSDMPTTNLVGELNSMNYAQFIVDTATEGVAASFNNIAKEDALTFYLVNKPVESEGLPWYMAPEKGQIQHIWAWEEADNSSRYKMPGDKSDEPFMWTGDYVYAQPGNPVPTDDGNWESDDFTYLPESEREDLAGICQNLVPIMSMMHTRYQGDTSSHPDSIVKDDEAGTGLKYGNWQTALAYVYYMYAMSHDVAKYDKSAPGWSAHDEENISPYSYDVKDPCSTGDLYAGPVEYDPSTHVFVRPADVCTNLYVHDAKNAAAEITAGAAAHEKVISMLKKLSDITCTEGYSQGTAKRVMILKRKRSIRSKHLTDPLDELQKYSKGLGLTLTTGDEEMQLSTHFNLKKGSQGLFIWDGTDETMPASTGWDMVERSSVCDNYASFQLSTDESDGLKVHYTDGGKFEIKSYEQEYVPHTTTGETRDVESGEEFDAVWNGEVPIDPHSGAVCHQHNSGCFRSKGYTCGHSEGEVIDTYVDDDGDVHDVCHHHSDGCYTYYDGVRYGDGPESTVCQHEHQDWNAEDGGCWMTLRVCAGHCGGHIVPKVNVVQKMTWKGLMQDDSFKTPVYLTYADIVGNKVGEDGKVSMGNFSNVLDMANWLANKVDATPTVAEWRLYWKVKCASWYLPFARSPLGWLSTITQKGIAHAAAVIDTVTGMLHNIFSFVTNTNEYVDMNYFDKRAQLSGVDLYDFDGWWSLTEPAEAHVYNDTYLAELEGFYGGWWTDKYEFAKEMWECFDVKFCNGFVEELTEEEIAQYMELAEAYGLNEFQRAILMDALKHVGKFYYSLTGPAHNNGINNESGASDCSGFVSGVLSRALGKAFGTSAAGFHSMGTIGGALAPGVVISKLGTTSNHVMIYLGKAPGGGHYVVDCSSTAGGSAVRQLTDSQISQYNSRYCPW